MDILNKDKNKNNQPVLQHINNGVVNAVHAMPMKDLTSDNGASFQLTRTLFERAYLPSTQIQTGSDQIKRESRGIHNGFVSTGPKSTAQKKWIGGNRDASSIISRRKMAAAGAAMNVTGAQSFKNTTDNNTRIDALARVRGGGARVPLKVTNRPVFVSKEPDYYRIISAGLYAITSGLVNVVSSTAYGVSPGFYKYTNRSPITALAKSTSGTFVRSYNVLTIHRTTGVTTTRSFDLYGTSGIANQTAMIDYLAGLDTSVIVVIATYDEPQNVNGSTAVSQSFVNIMREYGASANFGSTNGTYDVTSTPYTGFIRMRSAYILVGTKGLGVGNGVQRYFGRDGYVNGDALAEIDLRISVLNGQYTVVSG
jgi:hypothetical protein